ncbi:hypothetical protein WR25_05172 isoform I [Diploscapter pachys]|uniref:Calx-beta domain-containing protein n=1 Tax=Diploscapter pachys TaxID=2018661 RepID=A0A2A2L070_9BILA|nr:hypothetical protein WR25_05172 isoform G [Diploscapter pachys]PAV79666.1 hypothetical protein WR25_05172 isoform I [Diploscapter pachys]
MSSSQRKIGEFREIEKLIEETEVPQSNGRTKPIIEFSARIYAIDKNDKQVKLTIVRRGLTKNAINVNYTTVNGVAKRDQHFLFKSKSLQFVANEAKRDIYIDLIQGDDWRINHVFYVHLKVEDQSKGDKTKLGNCANARILFVRENYSFDGLPTIEFTKNNYLVTESIGWMRVCVTKSYTGCLPNGVSINFDTQDGSADAYSDYMPIKNGQLIFNDQEYQKYIDIQILNEGKDVKDQTFTLEIKRVHDPNFSIGAKCKTTITIVPDNKMLKNVMNIHRLLGHYLKKMSPGQQSWREQILNAVSVNAGDLTNATICDCITHALAFPWKFTFAFIPPPSLMNGYPSFIFALVVIGFLTAIVGDLASIFGCMVGIKDSVTAITLVALGTSMPDTFASKFAAENDDSADNAIGNVTGSNSVNVFLGLGVSWVVAAIYWAFKGEEFRVESGDLSFRQVKAALIRLKPIEANRSA